MLGARAGHHRDHGGRADLRVPPEQVLEAHRGLRGPGIPQVIKLPDYTCRIVWVENFFVDLIRNNNLTNTKFR